MNEQKLIWGAGFIDDDIVCEAMDYKPRRIRLAPWACAAAAAVVLVTALAVFARFGGNSPVLPPVSSGIGTSTGSPEYTAGTGDSSTPNDSSTGTSSYTSTENSTVTTTDYPVTPIPVTPIGDQKSYADTFEKFFGQENPATYGPPPTVEEIANILTPNPDFPENDVDSYYLIEVVRALTNEEYELICGASTGINGNTLYEVILVEDWITGKAIDRKAYVEIPAGLGAAIQLKGDPTYASGEKFTAALTKPQENWNDIYSTGYDLMWSPCDYALRYDLPDMDFTEEDTEPMLYYRGRAPGRQPISDLPFTTEEINIEAAKSTPQNPATYIQKIAVGDFIDFLRELWQQAGLVDLSQENAPDFSAGRVYPDDELVPNEWLPVVSDAEAMDKFEKIIKSDTSATEPEGALTALINRNVLCYALFCGVSREMLNIDWDSPYYHPDFENPIYPFSTEYFSDTQTIYDLAYATYERPVAEKLLYGVWDLSDEPRYTEENGQMYINNNAFPGGAGGPPAFIARSYVEITEKTDKKCTFIWHYPDVEGLNPPKSGYEFFYYDKTYTAEYIDGSWKLSGIINNIG